MVWGPTGAAGQATVGDGRDRRWHLVAVAVPEARRTEKLVELTIVATWHVVDGIHRLVNHPAAAHREAHASAANPADALANLSLGFLGDPSYADGRAATTSDYLDAANTYYQQDAQRMRAAGYGDRVYGRVLTSGGKTWLQYWLFSYYNPQNVLGFGVHEGDWEFIQVGLDVDQVPVDPHQGDAAGLAGRSIFSRLLLVEALWRIGWWADALAEMSQLVSLQQAVGLGHLVPLSYALGGEAVEDGGLPRRKEQSRGEPRAIQREEIPDLPPGLGKAGVHRLQGSQGTIERLAEPNRQILRLQATERQQRRERVLEALIQR